MPPQSAPTQPFPRIRRTDLTSELDEPTRLDVNRLRDVADPTVTYPRVSPIGAHTQGASAITPPPSSTTDIVNKLLDDRDRVAADARRAQTGRTFRTRRPKVRTVREEAARRAAAKLRHERHLEVLETIRAYLTLVIIFCLLVIVVGAGIVGYGIIAGWFTWRVS